MNKITKSLALAAVVFLSSCAQEIVENPDSVEKRVIEAFVNVVYNNTITPNSSGAYVIQERPGIGRGIEKENYIYIRYSVSDLKNNFLSTTSEEVAKRIGTYSPAKYYGPVLFDVGFGSTIKGLEEVLLTQREGAKFKIILPSWATSYGVDGSAKAHTTTTIYDIEVLRVVGGSNAVKVFVTDSLESYSNKYYNGLDSTKWNYYFKTTKEGIGAVLKEGESIQYYYVGRLLDGYVFDTNIEDTARKYNLYNANRTGGYAPADFTVVKESEVGSASVVKGMAMTFLRMKHGETAITYFGPELGYGDTQKDFGRYQSMFFEVRVVSDGKEDVVSPTATNTKSIKK